MALKVIGAGFGRTGTMSLKAALEQLGLGPCYHMVECLPRGPEHWQRWIDVGEGAPDWDAIFDGFGSCTDFPASVYASDLARHYPDAKVVLTTRDPERWFASTQETIFAPRWIEHLKTVEMGRFMDVTLNRYFDDRMHDRDHLLRRFEEHVAAVEAAVPPERLLVYEVREGWGPLCAFLGVQEPEGEFPFVNDTQMTIEIIDRLIADGFEAVLGAGGPGGA